MGHDGRLHCVSGNGIMSELGVGDEPINLVVTSKTPVSPNMVDLQASVQPRSGVAKCSIDASPIVIVKNYASKNSRNKGEILDALANWVSRLVEQRVAHVFVVSDNRESARKIAKALSSAPLNYIPFSDADNESALTFVASKLAEIDGQEHALSSSEVDLVRRLGGRSSDLQTLVHKLQSGETVTFAVEDIINRGVAEIRKTAFGDDNEEGRLLPWTLSQAWVIVRQLAKEDEIPFQKMLLDHFKDNENALRSMEQAGLITLFLKDGRGSAIRVGKPVYKWVFQRLADDKAFNAVQEIGLKEKTLSSMQVAIASCEEELGKLLELRRLESSWNPLAPSGVTRRIDALMVKLEESEIIRSRLEKDIASLKRVLVKDR